MKKLPKVCFEHYDGGKEGAMKRRKELRDEDPKRKEAKRLQAQKERAHDLKLKKEKLAELRAMKEGEFFVCSRRQ